MSLMQLLTVGRSLRPVKDGRSPFRPAQQGVLPKFGQGRVPEDKRSAQTAAPALSPKSVVAPLGDAAKPVRVPWLRKIFSPFKRNKTMNAVEAEPQSVSAFAPPKMDQAFPFGRWTLFSNPFNRKPKPKADAGPVQTELSLDAVKPVRNDLSDSDLEVVAVESRPAPPPITSTTTHTVAAEDGAPGVVWHRLKEHLFGAEKH